MIKNLCHNVSGTDVAAPGQMQCAAAGIGFQKAGTARLGIRSGVPARCAAQRVIDLFGRTRYG